MTAPKTAARAAAEWWAERIGAPTFKMDRDDATGQDRHRADLASVMGHMIASAHPVDEAAGVKFADELEQRVGARLECGNWVSLGVDYGPDGTLADAADAAGVSRSRFPWKTHMSITRDYVTAALGYGSPHTLIWQAPGWERPQCGEHQYTADWKPLNEVCTRLRWHEGEHGDWVPDPARCEKCGGTYVDHYAGEYVGHSWQPVGGAP